jgi:hypothetical protein
MKVHHYFKRHRIQGGKAIVSLVLRNDIPLFKEGYQFLEWTGDAYGLRDELNKQIEILERKHEKK